MKRFVWLVILAALGMGGLLWARPELLSPLAEAANRGPAAAAPAPIGDEAAALEAKRQQLAERETALAAKEQELKKLSAALDGRIKELNALKKEVEASLQQKATKADEERKQRLAKMLKIYRGLRPQEAATLMDKLDPDMAIEMLG